MDFRILGPLEVASAAGLVPLRAGKERALLADLLLTAGADVPTERLVEDLWEEPPPSATKIVQVHVSHLRRALPAERLVTVGHGYRLDLDDDELDLDRFRSLVETGREALRQGDAPAASGALTRALALWRAPPLVEFDDEPFAREAARGLDDLRLEALEQRFEADLRSGQDAELVPELTALVAAHPTRDRLRAHLMLALYRGGRQADALAVYREGSTQLDRRYGITPSPMLRELERRMLAHDGRLLRDAPRSPHRDAAPARPPPPRTFVGRGSELERMATAVDRTFAGAAPVIAISGEPGIGKTRLAQELASRAVAAGMEARWGRCSERDWAPAYLPWLEVLDRDGTATASLGAIVGDGRGDTVAGDARAARYQLFERAAQRLGQAARTTPLCIVLDDVHVADESSLLLLDFLARRLRSDRVLIALTFRDSEVPRGHPLSVTVHDLVRDGRLEHLPLSGLDADDVQRIVAGASDGEVSAAFGAAVHARTAGNPLFVTEIARLLEGAGPDAVTAIMSPDRPEARLPVGLRQAIGHRLDRLSPSCRATLALAAVLGQEFDVHTLGGLAGDAPIEELLDDLDEAIHARILEDGPAPGRHRFTHALTREALVGELANARRAHLHARAAAVIEAGHPDEPSAPAAALAHHLAQATGFGDRGRLVHWSLVAAERALADHAPEDAVVHLRRAQAAAEPSGLAAPDIRFALGRAKLALLETTGLDDDMREAFERYLARGAYEPAVAVATHASPPFWELGGEHFAEMLARARGIVPPGTLAEARVLMSLGWFAGAVHTDFAEADGLLGRAGEISRNLRARAPEARALVYAADVDYMRLAFAASAERALSAVDLAAQIDDAATLMQARAMAARSVITLGDLPRGTALAAAAFQTANEQRQAWWLAFARRSLALGAHLAGDLERAGRLADEGLEAFPRDPRLLTLRALVCADAGDAQRCVDLLDRLEHASRRYPAPGRLGDHAFAAAAPALAADRGVAVPLGLAREAAARVLAADAAPLVRLLARVAQALIAAAEPGEEPPAGVVRELEPLLGVNVPYLPVTAEHLRALARRTPAQHRVEAGTRHPGPSR